MDVGSNDNDNESIKKSQTKQRHSRQGRSEVEVEVGWRTGANAKELLKIRNKKTTANQQGQQHGKQLALTNFAGHHNAITLVAGGEQMSTKKV